MLSNMKGLGRDGSIDKGFKEAKKSLNINGNSTYKNKSVGAGTKFLKLGMIKDLKIALPALSEQERVVEKLNALSTETKKLESIYQRKLDNLEELKKSILQKAFSGELKGTAI
jgi:restriction endonuclease S subunit